MSHYDTNKEGFVMKKCVAVLAVSTCFMLATLTAFADVAPVTFIATFGGLILAICAVIAAIIVIIVLIVRRFGNRK